MKYMVLSLLLAAVNAFAAPPNRAAPSQAPVAMTVSDTEAWSVKGQHIPQAEAITRFRLKERLMSYDSSFFQPNAKAQVRVVEGDLTVNGNLPMDWKDGWGSVGLIVTGNLDVKGAIVNANENEGPFLLVGGQTNARAIVGGGAEFSFEGDAVVDELVIGHYNDGILIFKKRLTVPAVVKLDHHLEVRGDLNGAWFDPFDQEHAWSAFLARGPVLTAMQKDEWRGLRNALVPALLAGRKVLRSDLPPNSKYPKYGKK